MSKKIVHELSIEDLLKLAQGSSEPIVMEGVSESSKFIYALNIRHGDERIPAQLIYHTYRHWKGWANKPQPKPYFFRDFSKQFEQVRTKDGMCYLLDPKPFDLSKETYWLLRKDIREQRAKQKSKREKTPGSGETPQS